MKSKKSIISILSLSMLTACASTGPKYEAPAYNEHSVAYLKNGDNNYAETFLRGFAGSLSPLIIIPTHLVSVKEVDGKVLKTKDNGAFRIHSGRHTVTLICEVSPYNTHSVKSIVLDVKPGHLYKAWVPKAKANHINFHICEHAKLQDMGIRQKN